MELTPVFLPGDFHGHRSLAGCSPWDLPDPGIKPESPALTGVFFITETPGKPSHEPRVGQNHLRQSLFYNKVLTSSCNLLT